MKPISLLILIFLLISSTSCTQYKMVYDPRYKTEEMMRDELYSKDGPFILTIIFEKSLINDHIKVEGFSITDPADWETYFEGKLTDCGEYSCKTIKVNNAVLIQLHLNNKKIILDNNSEHSLSTHRYLFISEEDGKYILNFSNYPKVVW